MRKQPPCKPDCPERSGVCHGSCERYAQWVEDNKADKEERLQYQIKNQIRTGQIIELGNHKLY